MMIKNNSYNENPDVEKIERLLKKVTNSEKKLVSAIGKLTEKLDTYGKGTKIGGTSGMLVQSDLYTEVIQTMPAAMKSIRILCDYLGVNTAVDDIFTEKES